MTIAGRPLHFYFIAFALGSIFITFCDTIFCYELNPQTIFLMVVAVIATIIDVVLIKRWTRNPDDKCLASAVAATSFVLFIIGGSYSTATLAIVFWVIQQAFGMRQCMGIAGILIVLMALPRSLAGQYQRDDIHYILFLETIVIVHFSFAWLLTALEKSAEKERRYAVEAAVSMEQAESARMLHDGLGQQLVTAIVALDVAQALKSTSEQAAWSEVCNAQAVAKQALVDLRRWVRALDPPETPTPHTSDQLVAAMQSLSQTFSSTGLEFQIDKPEDNYALAAAQGELFQIAVREGVSNALRHGQPTMIHFHLRVNEDSITLTVEDYSDKEHALVPVKASSTENGYGLRSLRKRATQLGGSMTAGPTDTGFYLDVSLPRTENM